VLGTPVPGQPAPLPASPAGTHGHADPSRPISTGTAGTRCTRFRARTTRTPSTAPAVPRPLTIRPPSRHWPNRSSPSGPLPGAPARSGRSLVQLRPPALPAHPDSRPRRPEPAAHHLAPSQHV